MPTLEIKQYNNVASDMDKLEGRISAYFLEILMMMQ